MPQELFNIVFAAQLIKDKDPAEVRAKVGRMFKTSPAQLERLFSGKPVVIKKGVDMDEAGKYRLAFREAGALVEIRTSEATQPKPDLTPVASEPSVADPAITLTPANSGSLEDCAPKIEPAVLPDIGGMHMDNPGAPLDETPEPPPAHIRTDGIDLVPERNWTLEDCQPNIPPAPLPDIEALSLAAPDDESHIPAEPPPEPIPDISALELDTPIQEEDPKTDPGKENG